MVKDFTIALAGNPNAGKSTIFNALTGAHQHVGNWPGKTVEKKEGQTIIGAHVFTVIDLPGAYSLTAYSVEEAITRDFIVNEQPDVVVAVVDATNLERNLYLVVQLIELGAPVVVAINMTDLAEARGIQIDMGALSAGLGGVPVVATAARHGVGLAALREAILTVAGGGHHLDEAGPGLIDYGQPLEDTLASLQRRLEQAAVHGRAHPCGHRQGHSSPFGEAPVFQWIARRRRRHRRRRAWHHRRASREWACPPRWLALKLLEGEDDILARLDDADRAALMAARQQHADRIMVACDEDPETLIVDRRYSFIGELVRQAVTRPAREPITTSERLDQVLTHRWLGLPVFLLLMWIVFQMVANVSAPLLDWVDATMTGPFTRWAVALLGVLGLRGTWVESLLVDGIIAGVGGMLVFLPVLVFLYLAIALLEESGYMARAAFVMDRFMTMLGLHGKSFLPLLVGFGCNVPAIYATRTLEHPDDRKLTAFLTTFMSCGARLPVYVIFGSAFFGAASGHLIFALYLLGILVAILTGFVLKRTIFKNKPTPPFVMELPPYRLPTFASVWLHIRERTAKFIRGVGTVILITSVLVWFLLAVPVGQDRRAFDRVAPGDSLFGAISRAAAPVFAPAGFPSWEATGALVSGLVAKEVVVSTLSQIYVGAAHEHDQPPAGEAPPSGLVDDLAGIASGFGEALILTAQEVVNIVPRTINLLPLLHAPEADFLGRQTTETGDSTLEAALREAFTPLAALAFNVFVLLYIPCMSSLAAMRQEFGIRWTIFQAGYTLIIAWLAAVAVYQVGLWVGLG